MGGGNKFPYPLYVWSPAGGWWVHNRNWRRNTVVAFCWAGILGAAVAKLSLETGRTVLPAQVAGQLPQRFMRLAVVDDPRLLKNPFWAKRFLVS